MMIPWITELVAVVGLLRFCRCGLGPFARISKRLKLRGSWFFNYLDHCIFEINILDFEFSTIDFRSFEINRGSKLVFT